MGGRIAMALALRHPQVVRSLILVSTAPRQAPSGSLVGALLRVARAFKERTVAEQKAVQRQYEAVRSFDITASLPKIALPTLILHGRRDRIAPIRFAQEMQVAIPGARFVALPGGHLTLFMHPQPLLAAVSAFLDDLAAQAGQV